MAEELISIEQLSICVVMGDGKHYPTIGKKENMELFRTVVLHSMKALDISFTKKMGHLEFKLPRNPSVMDLL